MKLFQRISSFLLAIFVLFSSTGFVLNKHYCGGELKSISLLSEHASCDMCKALEDLPTCHRMVKSDHCCENEQVYVKTDDFKNTKSIAVNAIHFYTFELLETPGKLSLTNIFQQEYQYFKPPNIPPEDIHLKVQSFLI